MKKAAIITGILLLLSSWPLIFKLSTRHNPPPEPAAGLVATTVQPLAFAPATATAETGTLQPRESPPRQQDTRPDTRPAGEKVIYQNKVVVLMYHHFAEQEAPGLIITRQRFASHLNMLVQQGYHVISLNQLSSFLNGTPVPANAVLISFDDGYESVYQYALPELRRRRMPAVAFAIVGYAGRQVGRLRYYDWQEARKMAAAGVTTQSHTYNLHNYGILAGGDRGPLLSGPLKDQTPDDFAGMVYDDLLRSRQEIESHLQQPVLALAVPYGAASAAAIRAAVRAGFKLVFTTQPGAVTPASNPLALPRINAGSPSVSATRLDEIIRKTAGVKIPPPSHRSKKVAAPKAKRT